MLSGRRARLPGQCQYFELLGKSDEAGGGGFGGRGLRHLPIFERPFAKLICGQKIKRHTIWHRTIPHDPVTPDLFADGTTFAGLRLTVNACRLLARRLCAAQCTWPNLKKAAFLQSLMFCKSGRFCKTGLFLQSPRRHARRHRARRLKHVTLRQPAERTTDMPSWPATEPAISTSTARRQVAGDDVLVRYRSLSNSTDPCHHSASRCRTRARKRTRRGGLSASMPVRPRN